MSVEISGQGQEGRTVEGRIIQKIIMTWPSRWNMKNYLPVCPILP